nr:NADH dehydrogenase subunit 5 [Nereididae sp. SIO BIC A9836]
MVFTTTRLLFMMTILSLMTTSIVMYNQTPLLIEWDMLSLSSTNISIPIIIDPASMLFLSTVLMIATSVMQFTKTYMASDKNMDRFVVLVLLFVMSMVLLILFPHTMILLLGWDGLGITSFVLVIYYNNPKSLGAGLITALTNRIGDVMLLLAIAMMFNEGHWLIINTWSDNLVSWCAMLIMLAAMTKSAQLPFSSWLPAAMAAPTPVSALVHSSTLVTAGVYLLYRFYPLMKSFIYFKPFMMIVASATMLMAGASAMAECDMKKIIALSTLSQVAVMMFTLGLGLPEIAFFHLITHALFKALLFICAGNLIDSHHHNQDLRTMGNITTQMPTISTSITIANMALCGAPFLAGFYSKDLIIETMNMMINTKNLMIMVMFTSATILTTAYSTRFILYTTLSSTTSPAAQYSTESSPQTYSILTLTIMAVVGGAATNWMIITPIVEPNFCSASKLVALIMIMTGMTMGGYCYLYKPTFTPIIMHSHCSMWFLTPMSTHVTPKLTMLLPYMELKYVDQGWSMLPLLMFQHVALGASHFIMTQDNNIMKHIACISLASLWLSYMF